jgi:hypothetical protein
MTVGVIALADRRAHPGSFVERVPGIRNAIDFLQRSDAALVRSLSARRRDSVGLHSRPLSGGRTGCGVCRLHDLQSRIHMGVVPGGIGAYEAASVLTLGLVSVSLSVALSATLVFRRLSFWVPMAAGSLGVAKNHEGRNMTILVLFEPRASSSEEPCVSSW